MAKQLREDTMEPLSIRVLRKEFQEHPFGADGGFAAMFWMLCSLGQPSLGNQSGRGTGGVV